MRGDTYCAKSLGSGSQLVYLHVNNANWEKVRNILNSTDLKCISGVLWEIESKRRNNQSKKEKNNNSKTDREILWRETCQEKQEESDEFGFWNMKNRAWCQNVWVNKRRMKRLGIFHAAFKQCWKSWIKVGILYLKKQLFNRIKLRVFKIWQH